MNLYPDCCDRQKELDHLHKVYDEKCDDHRTVQMENGAMRLALRDLGLYDEENGGPDMNKIKNLNRGIAPIKAKEIVMMKIVIEVRDGATGKEIAEKLRFQAGCIEGMDPKKAASKANTDGEFDDGVEEAPKKSAAKGKAKAASAEESFDEDDGFNEDAESSFDDDSFEEEEVKEAPKKGKGKAAPKVTIDQVNDACKERVKKIGGPDARKKVLALLKKNFGVTSVSELEPSQYADVVASMKGK